MTTKEHDKCLEYIEKYEIVYTRGKNFSYTFRIGTNLSITSSYYRGNSYYVCWNNKKIPSITDKEAKLLCDLCNEIEDKQSQIDDSINLQEFYD